VKAKKKQKKRFPYDLFEHVKGFLAQTGHFSCVPLFRLHKHKFDQKSKEVKNLCFVNIQRGTIRTNCIDSLDRTNFAQEIIGYYACLKQLKSLELVDEIRVDMSSDFFKHITDMYNEMGDMISLQYGGSIAHHS
jgi:hypothetical protein